MTSLTLQLAGLDLDAVSQQGWQEMPALQTLLSKGSRAATVPQPYISLLQHFGYGCGNEELPVAAFSALGDGLNSEDGWWLCADPVHMVADRDQLYLSAHRQLMLSQQESDALLKELNTLYMDDGWQFFAPSPQRWYLRLPKAVAMRTIPTAQAMGRGVGEILPRGEDALVWQRVMTEVQMLFHSSVTNSLRADKGKLAVSGLWFWGGGALPEANTMVDWDTVITNESLSRGLAQRHQITTIPSSFDDVSSSLGGEAKVLWVDDSLLTSASPADHFLSLEQRLFSPLLQMLKAGGLSELHIELLGVGRWTVSKAVLRRWWRFNKPLGRLLRGS